NAGVQGPKRQMFYEDTPEGNALAEEFAHREDRPGFAVYDAINSFRDGATRRCRETVETIDQLACDIDLKDVQETAAVVLQKLTELPFPPSEIRQSGHGFHVTFRLKEPVEITDTAEAEKVRTLRARLTEWLTADPAIDRDEALLRRPGTTN